jgi:hypothetical protein
MSFAKKIINTFEKIKQIGKQSLAKLAGQTSQSKSSTHRQMKIIKSRSSHVCADFFQTETGNYWMITLILAALFIFGIKFNIGADTLAIFFSLINLDIYVGLSAASINRLEAHIRELLKRYESELKPILDKLASEKDLIGGADETFFDRFMVIVFMDLPSGFLFNEKIAKDRTFSTWEKETSGSINKFRNFLCLVSDRAKSLLKLSAHHSCTGVADLFHFLMCPVKAFKFSFARKLKTLAKEEKKINANLADIKSASDVHTVTEKLELINDKRAVIKQGQSIFRHELQSISTTVHPFDLQSQQQTSGQITGKLNASVSAIRNVIMSCRITDNKNALGKMEKQIAPIAALTDSWWDWVDTYLNSTEMSDELKKAVKQYLLPVVYFKIQSKKSKHKKQLRETYEKVYQQAELKLMAHPLAKEMTNNQSLMIWAKQKCQKYQRTTSPIEGRNGLLAGFNLNARGMTIEQLQSQTIIHNYWNKREDGTTAVERCFNFKPKLDPFEFIVESMKDYAFPFPRHRWKKKVHSLFQENTLAAA